MTEHYRVVSTGSYGKAIQKEHFDSVESAAEYIQYYIDEGIIALHETVEIIKDCDARTYPVWRKNRPRK